MDITMEDLQALTLLAQDPQRKDFERLKAELSTETARKVAQAIMLEGIESKVSVPDPIGETAKAILNWVDRNRAAARSNSRPEVRERKKAREWVTQHAASWQA